MQFIEEHVEEFFATARERYEILLRRRAKKPAPWSDDPVFQAWRFCNVDREDDTVTKWVKRKVRTPLKDDPRVLTAMAVCRFFNTIPTLEILHRAGVIKNWDGRTARELLQGVKPVTSAAYIIKTPNGMKKADGICWIIDRVDERANYIISNINPGRTTLQEVWDLLREFPYFGPFMAYEVVTDLRHTNYLRGAPDILSWACPGPGACRGLSWIMARNFTHIGYNSVKKRRDAINHMLILQNVAQTMPHAWPAKWPRWEMRTVEHWLCEYAKYVKVKYLHHRMKRKYP